MNTSINHNEADIISKLSSTVMVVDDEAFARRFFSTILEEEGHKCAAVATSKECFDYLKSEPLPDLIILDIRLPDGNGLQMLKELRESGINVPIIIITAYGSISDAVGAVKMGAFDYFSKPFEDANKIKISIRKALEYGWLENENRMLRNQLKSREAFQGIIGKSERMQSVYELIQKSANVATTVLIEGQSGTGKELVAKAIHHLSNRREKTFIPVNCAALPEALLESALFGYEKGSFTGAAKTTRGFFEEAHGGTLFLDEIGDAPASVQVKVLRAVEDGVIYCVGSTRPISLDVRLLFATNKSLSAEVAEGRFRKDLYYRINVVKINLPSLEECKDDIPLLVDSFAADYCVKVGVEKKNFSEDAIAYLISRKWPGNVRELKNFISRVIVLHSGRIVKAGDLSRYFEEDGSQDSESLFDREYHKAKEQFDRKYFERLIERSGDDLNIAAKQSGMHIATIYRKLDALSIRTKKTK
ncbi:MAG: sigma-54 dependent transcriptional regulator [Syntrophobacteraceae bacterium]